MPRVRFVIKRKPVPYDNLLGDDVLAKGASLAKGTPRKIVEGNNGHAAFRPTCPLDTPPDRVAHVRRGSVGSCCSSTSTLVGSESSHLNKDLPDVPVDVTLDDEWDDSAPAWTISRPETREIVIMALEARRHGVCGREWRNLITTYASTLASEPEREFCHSMLKKLSL